MARSYNTKVDSSPFDEKTIEAVWQKGTPEPQYQSFRKDKCGASMQRTKYGKTDKLPLEDLVPRIQMLRRRQEQLGATQEELGDELSNRKTELTDLKVIVGYVEDLRHLLMYSSLAERKAFIRSFVKEVKVTGDDVLLTYTIPLPPRGVLEEKAGVLSFVQHGSAYRIRTGDLLLEREVS